MNPFERRSTSSVLFAFFFATGCAVGVEPERSGTTQGVAGTSAGSSGGGQGGSGAFGSGGSGAIGSGGTGAVGSGGSGAQGSGGGSGSASGGSAGTATGGSAGAGTGGSAGSSGTGGSGAGGSSTGGSAGSGGAPAAGDLVVEYRNGDSSTSDNQLKPQLNIKNQGGAVVPLSELKVRYWFTNEAGSQTLQFSCDHAVIGCASLGATFGSASAGMADHYAEISFSSGTLSPGGQTGEIQTRINKSDWTVYDETNDWSFDAAKSSFTPWEHVTLYRGGTLIWGTEP